MTRAEKGITGLVVFTLAGMGLVAWRSIDHDPVARFHASPTEPRPWAAKEFDAAMHPVASTKSPLDPAYAATTTVCSKADVSTDPGKYALEIKYTKTKPAETYTPPYEVISFDVRDGFKTADGSGTVRGLAGRTNAPESRHGDELALLFTRPDGTVMSEEELNQCGIGPHERYAWVNDKALATAHLMKLQLAGYQNIRWRCPECYSAATQVRLAGGASYTSQGPEFQVSNNLDTVHNQSLVTVADFAHGPLEIIHGEAKDGTVLQGATAKVTVLAIAPGKPTSTGTGGSAVKFWGDRATMTQNATLVYRVDPPSMAAFVDLAAVAPDGQRLNKVGSISSEAIHTCGYAVPPDQIARLEVQFRSRFVRLLIHQPALSGVPKANQAPMDLFDVMLPVESANSDWNPQLDRILGLKLTGTASWHPHITQGSTPRETLRRSLAENPRLRVTLDEKAKTIELWEPASPPWLVWLKRRLGLP